MTTQRSINTIYQSIITEKNNMETLRNKLTNADGSTNLSDEQTLLDDLTTDSKVSIWKLWAYMTAVIIWFHESLWYIFRDDTEDLIEGQFTGTPKWLISKSKLFQYGDTLTMTEPYYKPVYTDIDETKQIIGSANITESGTEIYLKVRRKETDILTSNELLSFTSYINQIKVAGQRITVLNFNGDELKLFFNIYYDGVYNLTDMKTAVETAIYDYIENIEFDSTINITRLIDDIQQVNGVKGVMFNNELSGGKPFNATNWVHIDNYYNSVAGWNKISIDFPLTDTINYIIR